jgi:tetratricopeptide (TPR) repeat protein
MAIDQPAFDAQRAQALSQGQQAIELEAMTHANGQVLQINSENLELELVYRMYFGDGDGDSFRVPYTAIVQFRLACCHAQLGEHALALEELRRAIELVPAMRERAADEEALAPLRGLADWPAALS